MPKGIISAIRICCDLSRFVPSKYGTELNKIVSEGAVSKLIIIRKYTGISLRYILNENNPYYSLAVNCLKKLTKDYQDTVAIFATETLVYSQHSKNFFNNHILPQLNNLFQSKSWRIRYCIANGMENILSSVQSNTRKQILNFYTSYLNDKEPEVSLCAFKVIKKIARLIEPDYILQKIIPIYKTKLRNSELDVKKVIASSLLYLAPTLGKSQTNKVLKEIIALVLSEENPEVKIEIFKNIKPLSETVPLGPFLPLLNSSLETLSQDTNWKVRE